MMLAVSVRTAAFIATLSLLEGCGSNLVFYERSAFKLGISVGEDPTTPLEVTGGLKRSIVARVPPLKNNENRTAAGEATSLVSDFDLRYLKSGNGIPAGTPLTSGSPLQSTLKINTVFASGNAAREIASDPAATVALVDTVAELDELTVVIEKLGARDDKGALATKASALVSPKFEAGFLTRTKAGVDPYIALLETKDALCGFPLDDNPAFWPCIRALNEALALVMRAADRG